jgi:hypothetical protein
MKHASFDWIVVLAVSEEVMLDVAGIFMQETFYFVFFASLLLH